MNPPQPEFRDDSYLDEDPSEDQANQESSKYQKKTFLPAEYNKARRNITKLVNSYFDDLKEQVKAGAKLYVDRSKLTDIEAAISAYTGLRYNQKPFKLDLKLKGGYQQSKSKQMKIGLLSYLAQSEKIVQYNSHGKMSVVNINKGQFKVPDVATPVGGEGCVYFLDPCNFDNKRKVFVPEGPAFCISLDGKMKELSPPIYFRSKAAILKKDTSIYLLNGQVTPNKILTTHCQKYNTKTQQSTELPPTTHKHVCPSACFLSGQLWIFSKHQLQMFNGKQWLDIGVPFDARFLPFQFVVPVNENQILIFGGVNQNEKSRDVKLYNTQRRNVNSYGKLLPQGISNERNSAASIVQGCVAAMSSIQAAVYPQIGVKSNMCEVVYVFESTAYLNSVMVL